MAEGTRGNGCSRWFLLQEGPCPEAELDPALPGPRPPRRAMPSPGPGVPAEGSVCNPGVGRMLWGGGGCALGNPRCQGRERGRGMEVAPRMGDAEGRGEQVGRDMGLGMAAQGWCRSPEGAEGE